MFVDYVLNGQAFGNVGEQLAGCRFDPGLLRPYFDQHGKRCVTVNTGRMQYNNQTDKYEPVFEKRHVADLMSNGIYSPVFNATTLRKDEWKEMDRVVMQAARQRLRAWADLSASNTYGGFNGMSKTILEHETVSDPGEAVVDMDGLTEGRGDRPLYNLVGLPLPITHSDFQFPYRQLAVSRNSGTPLDTAMGEAAGRRVAEALEKMVIGISPFEGIAYGKAADYSAGIPTVYGYTNFTDRITKTDLTTPLGTNPSATLTDVLAMIKLANAKKFFGPFMLYHSPDWAPFLDNDYYITSGTPSQTLRSRLRMIEGITDVRQLDFLSDTFTLIMVQMTSDVCRAVNGMDITTVQWESKGGMQLNFKVMCIQVPQLRSDYYGNCGIVHATTA